MHICIVYQTDDKDWGIMISFSIYDLVNLSLT